MITTYKGSCNKCCGTGEIVMVSPHSLRKTRQGAGVSLREMARRLNFSAPYICDIELGRRACTDKIRKAYEKL